jgi:hypothetical protein
MAGMMEGVNCDIGVSRSDSFFVFNKISHGLPVFGLPVDGEFGKNQGSRHWRSAQTSECLSP